MQFEMLKEKSSIIKVIGVGGGGGNAVNHMYRQGITGVDFIICNTDAQALELSPIPSKIQLGASLTEGMGAGSIPEVGKNSAIENIEELKQILGANTKMLFITAGMGGGTGTGASPIIAKAAREMGILTVGIVTTPFTFEGKRRKTQAEEGLEELKKQVDSFLVISNDRLRQIYGNLTMSAAFAQADNILTTAAKGIAEIITVPGYINVDFKDVRTVMQESGVAIMGSASAEGDDRALNAVRGALASPLLKDNEIEGARYILLNISSGNKEVTMDEVSVITDFIQEEAGLAADLIWGNCIDENLGDALLVTIIATGFQTSEERARNKQAEPKKKYLANEIVAKGEESKIINYLREPQEEIITNQNRDEQLLKLSQSTLFDENVVVKEPTPQNSTQDSVQKYDLPMEDLISSASEHTIINETLMSNTLIKEDDNVVMGSSSSPLKNKLTDETFEEEKTLYTASENVIEFDFKLTKTENELTFDFPLQSAPSPNIRSVQVDANTKQNQSINNVDELESALEHNQESFNDQLQKSRERILRLKDLSMKLKTTQGIQELENEPAYKRKQMNLQQPPHSSESLVSRFTLSDNEDGSSSIRPNNSFLHDNVD